jgi:hypothetical protein
MTQAAIVPGIVPDSDSFCVVASNYAATFGEALTTMSEDEVGEELEDMYRKSLDEAKDKAELKGASTIFILQQRVLAYVAGNNLDADVARKLVYVKCKEGYFK